MKGRMSLHPAPSALPIPSSQRMTLKSLSMPTSQTSPTNTLQTDLGEFIAFPRYIFCSLHRPSSALQTEALEEFLSILRPAFLRKPRCLTARPRHRLDVTSDQLNLDPRDRTTPADPQEIHLESDARWFPSSLLCAYLASPSFIRSSTIISLSHLSHAYTQPIPQKPRQSLSCSYHSSHSCCHSPPSPYSR